MKPHYCIRNGRLVRAQSPLHDYIADPARRAALAAALHSHLQYLWQMATGWRGARASARMAMAIETATAGEVPKEALRPDIWPPADENHPQEAA